jgi:hypothetical protein
MSYSASGFKRSCIFLAAPEGAASTAQPGKTALLPGGHEAHVRENRRRRFLPMK